MNVMKKNVASLLASQMATWVISAILLIIAPSRLGAADFGRYQFVIAFVGFFTLVGSLGTSTYLVKQIARDHSLVGRLVVDSIKLKLIIGPVLVGAAMGLGWLLSYPGEVLLLIAIVSSGLIASIINEILVAGLAGMERMAGAALWTTVSVYLGTIVGIVVVMTSRSLNAYAMGFALATFVPVIGNYWAIRPFLRERRSPFGPTWKSIIVGGVPLFALSAVNLLYGTIDIPIIEHIAGSEVVGWYSLAYRWVGMPIFITTVVAAAFMPRLAASAHQSAVEFAQLTNRALRIVMMVTLPASAGLALVAADLLDFVYGNEYDNSISLMQILAIQMPIAAVDTILAVALIAADRQNRYLLVAIGAAVINPVLNIIAINITQDRYGNGAIGASVVTVVTELFILAWALRLRTEGIMDSYTWKFFGRCFGAVALMSIAVLLASSTGLFIKIAVGAIVFTAASLGLGTVSVDRVKRTIKEFRRARTSAVLEETKE